MPPPMMKLAMPVSPYPTFPRTREKGQTNRCASFTLSPGFAVERAMGGASKMKRRKFGFLSTLTVLVGRYAPCNYGVQVYGQA